MTLLKFIVFSCLSLLFILSIHPPLDGAKRVKAKSLKELSDPNSPSYVPCPFPKNKKEVLENLKHFVDTDCDGKNVTTTDESIHDMDRIFREVFRPGSQYKIKDIIKVKNRLHFRVKDYSWIIYIVNGNGNIVLTTSMSAEGHFLSAGCTTEKDYREGTPQNRKNWEKYRKQLSKKDVYARLADAIGENVEEWKIKKIERCIYRSKLSSNNYPLWEIVLKDGRHYFYSHIMDTVLRYERKIPWKFSEDREYVMKLRKTLSELQKDHTIATAHDTISDELLILKIIKTNVSGQRN